MFLEWRWYNLQTVDSFKNIDFSTHKCTLNIVRYKKFMANEVNFYPAQHRTRSHVMNRLYKARSHLIDRLNRLTSIDIDEEVLNIVMNDFRDKLEEHRKNMSDEPSIDDLFLEEPQYNNTNKSDEPVDPDDILSFTTPSEKELLSVNLVRSILRNHDLSQHYDSAWAIRNKIFGIVPATITHLIPEIEHNFDLVYEAYQRVKPPERLNFLPFTFVTRRLLERSGIYDYHEALPELMSRQCIDMINGMWSDVCNDLGWEE